ncbi:PDT-domain-containing protein [Hysterangium stoloniferum]|nr:PDT-domain-containing protein [Hysterangium stoloniferum]
MSANASIVIVAYLGPEGTYSHQACIFLILIQTFATLDPNTQCRDNEGAAVTRFAFLPWENLIYGQVIDTYDALRQAHIGKSTFVTGEYTFAVEHCLLVRKGTKLKDVRRILSHEQALGQCKVWLSKHIPEGQLVAVASTAAAAKTISESGEEASTDAAICSKICAELYEGLEVLQEGIQDDNNNKTRFIVLGCNVDGAEWKVAEKRWTTGLIRVSVRRGSSVEKAVGEIGLKVVRIDRRPSLWVEGDDYFVEVESEGESEVKSQEYWKRRVEAIGGVILGTWL